MCLEIQVKALVVPDAAQGHGMHGRSGGSADGTAAANALRLSFLVVLSRGEGGDVRERQVLDGRSHELLRDGRESGGCVW